MKTYIFGQCRILLQELDDTVGQLRVIHAETLHLVHGKEYPGEEELVLLLQRQSETIDNRAQDFEQFSNSVVSFRLIHKLEENVVDRSANIRAQVQEFSIDTMKSRLQEVTLPGIFRVKEVQQLD